MQRQCPICQSAVPAESAFCPTCGARMQPASGVAPAEQPFASSPPTDSASPYAPPAAGSATPYAPPTVQAGAYPPPAASAGGPYVPPTQALGGGEQWGQPSGQQPAYNPYAPTGQQPPYDPYAPTGQQPAYDPYTAPTGQQSAYPAQNPYQQPAGGAYSAQQQQPSGGYGAYPGSPYPQQPAAAPRRRPLGLWLVVLGVLLLIGAGIAAVLINSRSGGAGGSNGGVASNPTAGPTRTPRPIRLTTVIGSLPTDEPTREPTEVVPTATPLPEFEQGVADGSGRLIFPSEFYDDLLVMPAAGGPATTLPFTNASDFSFDEAEFAPDGSQTAYYYEGETQTSFIVRPAPDQPERVVATLPPGLLPSAIIWSPDSSKIAFVVADSDYDDTSEQNLFIIDVASSTLIQTTQSGNISTDLPPAWAPDSSRIAYGETIDTGIKVQTSNPDGSDPTVLFTEIYPTVAWLSDGRIIYDGYCESEYTLDLCAINPQDAQPKGVKIGALGDLFLAGVSPKGSWVLLQDFGTSQMVIRNLETGVEEQAAEVNPASFRIGGLWSPDERFFTFNDYDADATFVYVVGSNQPAQPLIKGSLIDWLE